MATVDLPSFLDLDISKFAMQPVRKNERGGGKSVYIDGPLVGGRRTMVEAVLPPMALAFPIRPDSNVKRLDTSDTGGKRLNMELSVPRDATAFQDKAREFDGWCLTQAYEVNRVADDKTSFFPELRAQLRTQAPEIGKAMLMGKYKTFYKIGKESGDRKYNDSIRLKVDGWFDYISELVTAEVEVKGSKEVMVTDCKWKDRSFDTPLADRDTQFFMLVNEERKTYTRWVPIKDASGKVKTTGKDASGKDIVARRHVSPADVKVGSIVTVTATFNKMYVTDSFGPTVSAKRVYFKPAPPRVVGVVAGFTVDDDVSTDDVLAAATAVTAAAEAHKDGGAEDPARDDEAPHGGAGDTTTASEPASASGERVSKKRRRDHDGGDDEDDDGGSKKKKKHRAAAPADDF